MKKIIQIVLVIQIFLSTTTVLADGLIYTELSTLAKNSAAIIEGTVIKVEVLWDKEHRFIYTYTTISVTKSYKKNHREIILKEIGGALDGFETIVQHKVMYNVDEKVLVFLQKEGAFFRTYGGPQGKFTFEKLNGVVQLRRNLDIDKLIFLRKDAKREEVKNLFKYSDLDTLITNHVGGSK